MHLRLSRFIHLLPIGDNRILLVDAIGHARVPVTTELAGIITGFAGGKDVPDQDTKEGVLATLIERGILTRKTAEEELQNVDAVLRRVRRSLPAGSSDDHQAPGSAARATCSGPCSP